MLALLLAGATLIRAGAPASIDSAAVKETRQVGGDVRVERVTVAMGTRVRVVVDGVDRAAAVGSAEAALREVERMDGVLSTWDAGSEMARVNGAPVGEAFGVSAELADLLAESLTWTGRTGGAFDAAVGALVDAWDLRGVGGIPTGPALGRARAASGPAAFQVNQSARTITRNHPDAWIDTGAFGKGAALRSARRTLRDRGVRSASVDLGGQILVVGSGDGSGWPVEVAHPARRTEPVVLLLLADVSVATSGNSERSVEVAGRRLGHILDPRTGRPTRAWGSVTVVTGDPLVADILSTSLFVLGPEAGMALSRAMDDVGVLFLVDGPDGLVPTWNPALERWLHDPPLSDALQTGPHRIDQLS